MEFGKKLGLNLMESLGHWVDDIRVALTKKEKMSNREGWNGKNKGREEEERSENKSWLCLE